MLIVVLLVFSVLYESAYAGTVNTGTSSYGVEYCSEPLSLCGDYYSTHFSAGVYKTSKNDTTWNISHAHTKYTYQNSNGDQFMIERVGYFSPSLTLVYSDYSGYNYWWTNPSYTYEFNNVNVDLRKGNNIVMFYYKIRLYDANGRFDAEYYPKRLAQDI